MHDFSIDLQAERIHSSKTREYFKEVIKSYYAESYRSAIVMLYSIAIADLLFKLEELKDLYDDESAKTILQKIEEAKENRNRLSEWEGTLIESINNETNLFAPEDYLHMKTLRDHRHLCAHPVLTEHYELYQPNKETARAHIRNILQGILTKPAILSKKLLNSLLEDLATKKNLFKDDYKLESYLEDRYFKRFNQKVKRNIFRSIWKIAFKLTDAKSEQNRLIIYRTVCYMINKDYDDLLQRIELEKDYYSDISDNLILWVAQLFNRYPIIYSKLNETFKTIIQLEAQRNANVDAYAKFLSPDSATHIAKIIRIDNSRNSSYEFQTVHSDTIIEIFNVLILEGLRDKAYGFIIEIFLNSNQYAQADERYDILIQPYLECFTQIELVEILSKISDNGQINGRRRGSASNREIINTLKRRFSTEPDKEIVQYLNL